MSICPWCKGKTPKAFDVCPLCGKNPHEHPSIAAGGFGSFEAFDDFDEPGGDLDVSSTTEPLASHDGPDVFGGGSFDEEPAPLKLEIDVVSPMRISSRRPVSSLQSPSSPAAPLPAQTNYRDPHQVEEPQDGPTFDAYEIAVLADFGPTPEKLWQFPSYAMRVTTRSRELKRRLQIARRSVDEAEQGRDARLAELAERLRPELDASHDFDGVLDTLRQIEETAASRNDALSARNEELGQKVSVVDREIEGHRKQESESKARVDVAAKSLDAARGEVDRATAAFKRAEIELRNAQELARAAAGPQARTAPPEHAAKLQSLAQILEERRAAVQAPKALFDEAKRVWNDADSAHKAVQRQIAELQKQRRGIEQSYAREIGMRSQGVQQAQSEMHAALVAIGAQLIEMNAPIVPRELRQAFFQSQDVLSSRMLEAERLNHAIVSADSAAVKKGWMVIVGGTLVSLLLLIALIALFGRSEPEPLYGMNPVFEARVSIVG